MIGLQNPQQSGVGFAPLIVNLADVAHRFREKIQVDGKQRQIHRLHLLGQQANDAQQPDPGQQGNSATLKICFHYRSSRD